MVDDPVTPPEGTPTPPVDTTDTIKAVEAKLEKVEGQYKSLQSKYNAINNTSSEELKKANATISQLKESFEVAQTEVNLIKKTAFITELSSINPKLAELHKDSSIEVLQASIITAKAMKGDFPQHIPGGDPPKKPVVTGPGSFDHLTRKWIDEVEAE